MMKIKWHGWDGNRCVSQSPKKVWASEASIVSMSQCWQSRDGSISKSKLYGIQSE